MQKKKYIVFDFDGVICESTDECMVTSWNAWEMWESRSEFRRKLSDFSEEDKISFRKLRPYIRGAGEYYILRRAQSDGVELNGQNDIDHYGKLWNEFIEPFKNVFFDCRNKLRGENLLAWIELHPVFQEVIDLLINLNRQNRLYIATLKDGESVKLILQHHGVIISPERMLDQSQIKSKVQALDRICEIAKCEKSDILFLDDNFTHLVDPFKAGYLVYLTNWGTALPEFAAMAKDAGIPSITISELKEMF